MLTTCILCKFYSETCLNRTLNQTESCINWTLNKVPMYEIIVNLINLYKLNTCIFWAQKLFPVRLNLDRFHCLLKHFIFVAWLTFTKNLHIFGRNKLCLNMFAWLPIFNNPSDTTAYHPSLLLYLPADSISKTCIKVHVSWAGLINSEQELSPNYPNI